MTHLFFYWLIFGLLFLFLEIINPGLFFFFSFFIGTLGAAALTHFDFSLYGQIIGFFLTSAISFVLLCAWLKIKPFNNHHDYKTNMFALQGKRAVVLEEIHPFGQGLIKISGELWAAKAHNNEYCPVGSVVEIIDVVGCHCGVRLVHKVG